MSLIVKKYSNRRLYDTDESRYITLEELTEKVRAGADVRVLDAKTGDDLTQATLTQIILETKAARLLPVPLLSRLIRMQDDSLGEFFSQYVSAALDLYLQAKQGAQAMSPYFPFANVPFAASNAFARLFGGMGQAPEPPPPATSARRERPRSADDETARDDDVATLRRELDELKREMRRRR
jgi:polyhydroxyalkanoate synthesis repressor PhaR